eukprot:336816-Pleurochrysis_carterae.AAC.5
MAAHATPTAGVAAIGVVAAVAVATAALFLLMERKHKATKLVDSRRFESVRLSTCEKLPAELRVERCALHASFRNVACLARSYIDLAAAAARGYEHIDYLHAASNIVAVLDGLHDYATGWLNEAISTLTARCSLDNSRFAANRMRKPSFSPIWSSSRAALLDAARFTVKTASAASTLNG